MGSSRVEQALNELDPGSRAVVDLSLGTDFSDENIATLIRVEPDEVARRRERAIDALQHKLGDASHDEVVLQVCAAMGVEAPESMLHADSDPDSNGGVATGANGDAPGSTPIPEPATAGPEPDEAETSEPAGSAEAGDEPDRELLDDAEPEAAASPLVSDAPRVPAEIGEVEELEPPEPRAEIEPEPALAAPPPRVRPRGDSGEAEAERPRRRRVVALLAPLVAAVIATVGVVALSGDEQASGPATRPDSAATDDRPTGPLELTALPDAPAGAGASVVVDGDRVTISLDGLPDTEGDYEAWLFNSVLDSRPLGSTDGGSGTIEARLPDSTDSFEYLDISVQPDSGALHSGQSVLRIPVEQLGG